MTTGELIAKLKQIERLSGALPVYLETRQHLLHPEGAQQAEALRCDMAFWSDPKGSPLKTGVWIVGVVKEES